MKYNNIMDDENLVKLFKEILARRDQLDKENYMFVGGITPMLELIFLL